MNKDIGHAYSTSPNAGIIRFVGGPHDGDFGLFDHDQMETILFTSQTEPCFVFDIAYKRIGHFLYGFVPKEKPLWFWQAWIGG